MWDLFYLRKYTYSHDIQFFFLHSSHVVKTKVFFWNKPLFRGDQERWTQQIWRLVHCFSHLRTASHCQAFRLTNSLTLVPNGALGQKASRKPWLQSGESYTVSVPIHLKYMEGFDICYQSIWPLCFLVTPLFPASSDSGLEAPFSSDSCGSYVFGLVIFALV